MKQCIKSHLEMEVDSCKTQCHSFLDSLHEGILGAVLNSMLGTKKGMEKTHPISPNQPSQLETCNHRRFQTYT